MTLTPDEFYSRHAEDHDNKYKIDDLPEQFHEMLDQFTSMINGGKILDAGCGTGRDTQYFQRQGFDTHGVDIAQGMVEYAQNNRGGRYYQMDIRDLGFADESFDGLWSPATIYFVDKSGQSEALKEFYRVLKSDGIARIGFKVGDGVVLKSDWGDAVNQHLVERSEAREMVEASGFNVQSVVTDEPRDGVVFVNYSLYK